AKAIIGIAGHCCKEEANAKVQIPNLFGFVLGNWFLESESWVGALLRCGRRRLIIRGQGSEIRSQRSGVRGQESGVRNQSGVRSQESSMSTHESQLKSDLQALHESFRELSLRLAEK